MTKVIFRLLLVGSLLLFALTLAACSATSRDSSSDSGTSAQPTTPDTSSQLGGGTIEKTEDVTELKTEDLTVGTGTEAKAGDQITVHYTGWLTDGTKFDSSLDKGEPLALQLGVGQVIPGWDQGIVGMKVGGKRKLTIPPDLAYGEQGAGNGVIPPNATLVFEVELKSVQ